MVLFVIVGGIFTLFGAGLLYLRFYYRKHARRVWGKVVALEKYEPSRSSRNSQRSIVYRPVVEYIFNGETYRFTSGGSSNNIYKYKVNQRVRVLSLDKGPEYVMLEDGVVGIMGNIFFLLGLVLVGVGLWQLSTRPSFSFSDWAPLLFILPAALIIFIKVRKSLQSNNVDIADQMLKSANLETDESLAGRTIYWSSSQIKKEVNTNNKIGLTISTFFLVGSLTGLYFTWQALPPHTQELLSNLMNQSENFDKLLVLIKKKDPKLIGFLIALFFSLMGTHSFIYSSRKLNS
jgi:hypothetical protein